MSQITIRLADEDIQALDEAARRLKRSRADVVRQAIEHYLEDYADPRQVVERLQDPTDPVLDWEDVKRELLDQD